MSTIGTSHKPLNFKNEVHDPLDVKVHVFPHLCTAGDPKGGNNVQVFENDYCTLSAPEETTAVAKTE